MDYLYIIAIVVVVLVLYIELKKRVSITETKKSKYNYQAKQHIMTKSEIEFFGILNNVAGDRYYIFPQVHLSAILDEKIKGQNWKSAFKHINGKSVDYVLCDKITLKPTYAVELDDYTHNYSYRQERDQEVESIFRSTDIPLVRFSDYRSLTQEDIARRFIEARNQH